MSFKEVLFQQTYGAHNFLKFFMPFKLKYAFSLEAKMLPKDSLDTK